MTKSQRKPKAVKGALLIMVLTVMFVLIFLLAGTIAVVYSSNNRVMNKYEESQAYYTARSVLDSYINTFLKDNANVSGQNGTTTEFYYHIKAASGGGKALDKANAKQGRALELDLYNLAVDVNENAAGIQTDIAMADDEYLPLWLKEKIVKRVIGDNGEGAISAALLTGQGVSSTMIKDYAASVEFVRNKVETASATAGDYKYWRRILIDSANPSAEAFKHNSSDTRYSVYTLSTPDPDDQAYNASITGGNTKEFYDQFVTGADDTMYYVVPAGTFAAYANGPTSGSYGKLVDTVAQRQSLNGFGADYPDAVIKVQLLERCYNISAEAPGGNKSDFKFNFDGGARKKDYIKVQVTATVYYDGQPTTTSIVYKTEYSPTPSSDKALTAFGGIDMNTTSGSGVTGGLASLNNGMSNLNVNSADGSWFYAGGVTVTANNSSYTVGSGDCIFVRGDLKFNNKTKFRKNNTSSTGFMFVGGDLGGSSSPQGIEECQIPAIVGGTLYGDTNGGQKFKNDVWCNTLDLSSDTNGNSFYCDGTLYLNNIKIDSHATAADAKNVKIDGTTLTFVNNNFKRIVYDQNGTVTLSDGTVKHWSDFTVTGNHQGDGGTPVSDQIIAVPMTGSVKADYDDASHYTYSSDDGTKTFKMPTVTGFGGTMTGSERNFVVDTVRSRYGQYYGDDAFNDPDTNGDLKYTYTTTDQLLSQIAADGTVETGENRAKSYTGSDTCILSGGTMLGNSDRVRTGTSAITAGNYIWKANIDTNNGVNWDVDTSGGTVVIQLENTNNGVYNGRINVKGTGKCVFLVPEGSNTFNLGGDACGLRVEYEQTKNAIASNGNTIGVGAASDLTPAPEIDYYVGTGSKVMMKKGGSVDTFFHGYYYGPTAKLEVDTNTHGDALDYDDGSGTILSENYIILGTIVTGDIKCSNTSVGFVSRNTDTSTPGDRLFGWADVYYQRGE